MGGRAARELVFDDVLDRDELDVLLVGGYPHDVATRQSSEGGFQPLEPRPPRPLVRWAVKDSNLRPWD